MKKVLLIIVLLLVVGWGVTTWLIGGGVEKGLTMTMESMSAELSGTANRENSGLEFVTSDVKRGFLSSTAVTTVTMKDVPEELFAMKINSKVSHGPLMFTSDGVKTGLTYTVSTPELGGLPEEVREMLEEGFSGKPPLSVGTLVGFGGAVESTARMPLFSYTGEDADGSEMRMAFAGMEAKMSMPTVEGGGIVADLRVGEMKLSTSGGESSMTMHLPAGTGSVVNTPTQPGWMPEQEAEMLFPTLAFSGDFGEVTLKDIGMTSVFKLDDTDIAFEGSASFGFGGAEGVDKTGMGEGILDMLEKGGYYEVSFKGLDAAALARVEEVFAEFSTITPPPTFEEVEGEDEVDLDDPLLADPGAGMPDIDPNEAFDAIVALFKPGTEMEARVKIGDGDSRTELVMTIGYADNAAAASEAETLGDFVNSLEGRLEVRVPKSAMPEGMAEDLLGAQIEGGMIEDRGDYLRGVATMKNSTIELNGQEMPFLESLEPMMAQPFTIEGLMGLMMGGMGGPDMGPEGFGEPPMNDLGVPGDFPGVEPDNGPMIPDGGGLDAPDGLDAPGGLDAPSGLEGADRPDSAPGATPEPDPEPEPDPADDPLAVPAFQ